jgi:hypothetical protein
MQPKRVSNLEVMAPVSIGGGALWGLQTSDKLEHVIAPLYLNRFSEHGLRKHDRIMVTANYTGEAECAWLLVTNVVPGKTLEVKAI